MQTQAFAGSNNTTILHYNEAGGLAAFKAEDENVETFKGALPGVKASVSTVAAKYCTAWLWQNTGLGRISRDYIYQEQL